MIPLRILVTGGCGFIGHHVVEHVLRTTDWSVVVLDKLTYASSGFDRLRDVGAFDERRVRVLTCDLANGIEPELAREIGGVDYVAHFAAETHVDRSIEDARPFVRANVLGTCELLEYVRHYVRDVRKVLYFSTDEVFGPAPDGVFYGADDRYDAGNPYAATKAGGEQLALAYANTYRIPVAVTHGMNVFGERQHHEKFIPLCIRAALLGETVKIHADATRTRAGSRHYIHARNVADAVLHVLELPGRRDRYNIVGEVEVDNLTLAQTISAVVRDLEPGAPGLRTEMVDFHSSRPGHDLRYALDGSRLNELGWRPPVTFDASLRRVVAWSLHNRRWLGLT